MIERATWLSKSRPSAGEEDTGTLMKERGWIEGNSCPLLAPRPSVHFFSCDHDLINSPHLVGTSKCEIWEVGDDTAEVLVHGHMDDIYTAEWHPNLPK
jgi:hypothetical protein